MSYYQYNDTGQRKLMETNSDAVLGKVQFVKMNKSCWCFFVASDNSYPKFLLSPLFFCIFYAQSYEFLPFKNIYQVLFNSSFKHYTFFYLIYRKQELQKNHKHQTIDIILFMKSWKMVCFCFNCYAFI